jgi:hypothetical protein
MTIDRTFIENQGDQTVSDVRLPQDIGRNLLANTTFTFGVDNIFDTAPLF